jgi:DNA-binding transcriptional LysR family regulator
MDRSMRPGLASVQSIRGARLISTGYDAAMELRHLLALDAVLATGSFTAAAAARHVSQPALWMQIKELEAELGLALFARAGRGVAPTAACEALRPRLRVALHDVAELRRAADEVRAGWAAPARIGCGPWFVTRFLAGCIQELAARDARTPFPVVVPVTSGSAIEALAQGRVDLLVEPRAKAAGLDAVPLYPIEIVAVGPATAAARRGLLDVRALAGRDVATLPADSLVRRRLDAAAAKARVAFRVVYETRDASALLALAKAGVCTAILHDEPLDPPDAARAVRLVVRGRPLVDRLWLSWRDDAALSPAAAALRDVMRRRARALRARR